MPDIGFKNAVPQKPNHPAQRYAQQHSAAQITVLCRRQQLAEPETLVAPPPLSTPPARRKHLLRMQVTFLARPGWVTGGM